MRRHRGPEPWGIHGPGVRWRRPEGFADGLKLVKARGEAMQEAASDATPPTGMVSVLLLPIEKVEELCVKARIAGTMQIAKICFAQSNTVVSGKQSGV